MNPIGASYEVRVKVGATVLPLHILLYVHYSTERKDKAMLEKWMPIEDCPDVYVSNQGNVKKGTKLLPQYKEPQGYLRVVIPYKTGRKTVRVHRLVASAFLPKADGKTQVDHKNENKEDNRAVNLQWVTSKENTVKAGQNGKLARYEQRIPIVAVNVDTLSYQYFDSQADAEKQTGISNKDINACLRKRRYTTGQYKFYYLKDWRKL